MTLTLREIQRRGGFSPTQAQLLYELVSLNALPTELVTSQELSTALAALDATFSTDAERNAAIATLSATIATKADTTALTTLTTTVGTKADTSAVLLKANNLSDLPSPASARGALGLGSAATSPTSAFDAAGAGAAAAAAAVAALTKANVGLGNVDNTSDANKPVSTATAAALASAATTATAQYKASAAVDSLYYTEPSILPLLATDFVATSATMLLTIEVAGRAWGLTGATIQAFVCDSTLGRRPCPKTQTEYQSGVAGVSSCPVGVLGPRTGWPEFARGVATGGQGLSQSISRTVKITGLTVGHTYYVDVTNGIVGGADTVTSVTQITSTAKLALVGTDAGKLKAYVCSGTAAQVKPVTLPGVWETYVKPSQGSTIATTDKIVAARATPDQTKVLVATFTNTTTAGIQVIDTTTDTVTATYAMNPYVTANGIEITPDSATAWLMRSSVPQVVPMTIATGVLGTPITIPASGIGMALSPDGTRLCVLTNSPATMTIYNTANGATVGSVAIPAVGGSNATVSSMVIKADGLFAYVVDVTNNRLHEIDLTTRTIVRTLSLGSAGAKSYGVIRALPGSVTRSLLLFSNSVGGGASNATVCEVHLDDWVIYTEWNVLGAAQPGLIVDARIGARGEIVALDYSHTTLDYWYGGKFAIDSLSSSAYLHLGEGVQVWARPGS